MVPSRHSGLQAPFRHSSAVFSSLGIICICWQLREERGGGGVRGFTGRPEVLHLVFPRGPTWLPGAQMRGPAVFLEEGHDVGEH